MSEPDHDDEKTLGSWQDLWENGKTPWMMKNVNPELIKRKDDLLQHKKRARVLFPLCGNVPDMKYLADLGHQVVGVETSDAAILSFFRENNLHYSISDCDAIDGRIYTSADHNIKIYCCDFFRFCSEQEKDFDAIWDRGALNAISVEDRQKYVAILISVSTPDCVNITEMVQLHGVDESEQIYSLFGPEFNVMDLGLVKPYAKEYENVDGLDGFHFYKITRMGK